MINRKEVTTTVERDGKKYTAEKIFVDRKPRSRLILEKIKQLREHISSDTDFDCEAYFCFWDVDEIKGEYYILREEEKMTSLSSYLENNDPSFSQKVCWIRDILTVLEVAEDKGCDWPGISFINLRVNKEGDIRVFNPGLAGELNNYRTLAAPEIEPELFIPPEVHRGESWHTKGWLYSLGILMYIIFSKNRPFSGQTREERLDRILSSVPVAPHVLNYDLAPEFSTLIMDLLEENYSSVREVKNILDRLEQEDNLLADEEQKRKNRRGSSRRKSIHEFRDRLRFFFKNTGRYVVIGFLCLVVLGYIFYPRGPEQVVTENTSYREVVEYFYRGLDEKQTHYLEQSTVRDVAGLDEMLTGTFVMEQMRKAYSNMAPGRNRESSNDNDEGSSSSKEDWKAMGLEKLEITEIEGGETPLFRTEYIFFAETGEGTEYYRMQDRLELERVDGIWKIISLEGDVEKLINRGLSDMEKIE